MNVPGINKSYKHKSAVVTSTTADRISNRNSYLQQWYQVYDDVCSSTL